MPFTMLEAVKGTPFNCEIKTRALAEVKAPKLPLNGASMFSVELLFTTRLAMLNVGAELLALLLYRLM